MSVEVVMPQMGESITEGTVSKWLKAVGDKIEKDEPILEISTDKVDAEVPSPGAGILLEVRTQEGETVEVGTVVAVIGEEMGFIGLFVILLIYVSLINYLFKLSKILTDPFQSLLVSAVACWIAYQSLINIAAIVAAIPLTGVPLPFISYGGSSLLTLLTAMGLIKNIEKNNQTLLYSDSDNENKNQKNNHHRHSLNSRSGTNSPVTRR